MNDDAEIDSDIHSHIDHDFQNLINDGIQFLHSLTVYYGQEKGLEVWDHINEVIDTEVRAKVLFTLIGNPSRTKIEFKSDSHVNGVSCIKTIRSHTGMGLKDAKDLWDESREVGKRARINIDRKSYKQLRDDLIAIGCQIF